YFIRSEITRRLVFLSKMAFIGILNPLTVKLSIFPFYIWITKPTILKLEILPKHYSFPPALSAHSTAIQFSILFSSRRTCAISGI
ncbi:MAG: hypothetical protein ACI81W_004118, partial [Saprospiraceae bacterium]